MSASDIVTIFAAIILAIKTGVIGFRFGVIHGHIKQQDAENVKEEMK